MLDTSRLHMCNPMSCHVITRCIALYPAYRGVYLSSLAREVYFCLFYMMRLGVSSLRLMSQSTNVPCIACWFACVLDGMPFLAAPLSACPPACPAQVSCNTHHSAQIPNIANTLPSTHLQMSLMTTRWPRPAPIAALSHV